MELFFELKKLGVNIEEGMERLCGNEALYRKLLGTFVKSIDKYPVSIEEGEADYKEATDNAHAIKGMAGNLSLTPIFEAYSRIVDLLRAGDPGTAKAVLEDILPVQEKILSCIEKNMQ